MARSKPYYLQFDWKAWLVDRAVTDCSPATRAVWFDWLMWMAADDRCGMIEGDLPNLVRLGRCSPEEALAAILEIVETGTADVRFGDVTEDVPQILRKFCADSALILREFCAQNTQEAPSKVTLDVTRAASTRFVIINRRMKDEHDERKAVAERKKRQRDRARDRYQKRSSEDESPESHGECHGEGHADVTTYNQNQSQNHRSDKGQILSDPDPLAPDSPDPVTPDADAFIDAEPPDAEPPPPDADSDQKRTGTTRDPDQTMIAAISRGLRWLDRFSCKSDDCAVVFQVAWLTEAGKIPEHWGDDAAFGLSQLSKRPRNPIAYFRRMIAEHATKADRTIESLLERCPRAFAFPKTYIAARERLARGSSQGSADGRASVPRPNLERVS